MILGFIEHDRGMLNKQSLEMLSLAKRFGKIEAIIIGEEGRSIVKELGHYGVSVVHLILHEELNDYAPLAWGKSIAQLAAAIKPDAVFAISTDRSNEVMAHTASLMNLPLASNCKDVQFSSGLCTVTRFRWGGSLLEEANLNGEIKLATIAPFVFAIETNDEILLELKERTVDLEDQDLRVKVFDRIVPESDKVLLTDTRVVVSGGRGVGSSEGFGKLEELADILGGAVGCSRVVTNNGWRPHSDQVGQTGARVAPDLYIACGISGAIQHWVGCKSAKNILVINTDPEAPIVAKADYAIIADLHEIIPALNEELKKHIDT